MTVDFGVYDVIERIAAVDPIDREWFVCFFCKVNESEDHDDNCPWWMARELLGLPSWPGDT